MRRASWTRHRWGRSTPVNSTAAVGYTVASAHRIGPGTAADLPGVPGSNRVRLDIPALAPAADTSAGVGGLHGALLWELGPVGVVFGSVGFGLRAVQWANDIYICVGVASAPAPPADLSTLASSPHAFGEAIRRLNSGVQKVSTFCRNLQPSLLDSVSENRPDTRSLSWSISLAGKRFGGQRWRHHYGPDDLLSAKQTTALSPLLPTNHRLFAFLAWGPRLTHPAPRQIVLDLAGRPVTP